MMKNYFKMHTKILLLCIICTLTALILQTVIFQKTSSELIYEQSKEEGFNSLQNLQDDIYSFISEIETNLIRLYNERELILDLKNETDIEDLRATYYRLAFMIASQNFDTQSGVVALYLYDARDQIISTYRRASTPKHNYPVDIYSDDMDCNAERVKDYIASDDTAMLVSGYYNESRQSDIVRFVLKLYGNSNSRQKIGYVVCDIDTKVLRYMIKKYMTSDEMFLWLQPLGDRPVFSMGNLNEKAEESYEKLTELITSGGSEVQSGFSEGNQIIFQVDQSKYNLVAYSVMSQDLLKENQKKLTQTLFVISGVMICFAVVVSTIFSRTLTKPLDTLTKVSKRIKDGETKLRAPDLGRSEVGDLGQSINEMLDQIQELVGREYETKLLLNKAEYNALQAQINPHFLYNTLDTMSSIAQIRGCDEVSSLSQSLSNIFRYSLDMKNPLSTVSKEIIHLKNYIYVMNVRMNEGISYELCIDDSVLQDSIPRISIQPIVENAINHGLKNFHGEKKIRISARHVEGNLQIVVEDNGVGMNSDEVSCLLDSECEEEQKTTSIGLKNINERMKRLYGESFGLVIESEPGGGTIVTLTIPGIKMEEVPGWKQ